MKKYLITKALKPLLPNNYWVAKAEHTENFYYSKLINKLKSRNRKSVIVYQMGKVGSSTVCNSLKKLKINTSVYHIHVLTENSIKELENVYKDNFHKTSFFPQHILESQYLRKQLNKGRKEWKVVTLVREPVSRNISLFFQVLNSGLGYNYKEKLKYMTIDDIVNELQKLFFEENSGFEKYNGHEAPLHWFETEIEPTLNIDVFSREFPRSQGYELYQSDLADLLLIRLENLNECAGVAFKKFLDINDFTLAPSNISKNKSYSQIYQRFLDTLVLPEHYIDKLYSSKYMNHFYSKEEIATFRARWRVQSYT